MIQDIKELIDSRHDYVISQFDSVIESSKLISLAAQERLAKMSLNLNTLALTAWVVTVSWKFDNFKDSQSLVYISTSLHVTSLILLIVSEFMTILHANKSLSFSSSLRADFGGKKFIFVKGLQSLSLRMPTIPSDAQTKSFEDASALYEAQYKKAVTEIFESTGTKTKQQSLIVIDRIRWGFGIAAMASLLIGVVVTCICLPSYIRT